MIVVGGVAVLAARHMAAERRGATALDGRHHIQLVEAEVVRHWQTATRGLYENPAEGGQGGA